MAIRKRKKPDLVLPLSSMGDIAFLLIIFFMLASNFMKQANVELDQPKAASLEQQEAAKHSVVMDKDGVIWYEGQQLSSASEVTDFLRPLAEADHEMTVHVTIHNTIPHKEFMPLVAAVSESGAKMILTGEPEE